ncbi:MAG: hypothetical protein P8Z79_00665 [Sedimentisphaerales bacterium]
MAAHLTLHGQHEEALNELRIFSDKNFKDALPHILAGYIHSELRQYNMAIQSYDEAHRRGDHAVAAVGTSLTYLYAGNMPEATQWINIGLKYDAKSRSGRIVKAILLRMNSKYEEALQLSEQLLQEDQSDSYALVQRAWCLYTLRRYRNAFKEARRLLALKKGLHVSAYSIIASSLCEMNKLLFAERFIKRVLTVASDGPDKTNMYRTLWSIALKQGKHREAVRCAVRMCRLSPEKPLPKLWLIQGLRNTGHPSLSRRFATFSVDRSQLSEYETAEIARAYIFLEDFYKAADFASSISNENILRIVIREIREYYLAQLYIGLSYLLNMRLMGVERGDWRGPFDTFMRLFRTMPQKDITKFMLYEPFVLLTLLVRNEDFAREWCRRWEKVPLEHIPTQTRGLGCWRIYARLKCFETNEDVKSQICKVCKRAFDELTDVSLSDSMSLTVTSLTAIVIIEIGESRSNAPVLERLFGFIEDLKSEQITLGSMCALSLLSIMLARKAQISYVVRLASLVRPFMRFVQDKRIACDLAYILSIGCRVAVILQDANIGLESLLTEVSSFLSELEGDDLTQRVWPVKWNFGLACIHDMFKRNVDDDKLSDRIRMLMDEFNCAKIPKIIIRRYACAFLGSVTCYAFNYYRDQLGNSLFNKWKETFLWDRALSSQTRLMRIRIEGTISNRPIDEVGLIPIMEDSDPDLMQGWEERLLTWIQLESFDADSRNDLTRRIMKLTDSVEFFKTRPTLDASK